MGDPSIEAERDNRLLPDVSLWIYDSDAGTVEIERGVGAALESLREAGVSPAAAYLAAELMARAVPYWPAHFEAWENAERAAWDACFKDWARVPEHAVLMLG